MNTHATETMPTRFRRLALVMSAVVLLFFGVAVAAPAQAADPAPSPYPFASPQWVGSREWIVLCTGFASCTSSGYSEAGYQGVMYNTFWRQSTGHNCTNYVAYRLVQNGLPNTKPSSLSGNAFNWGPSFPSQTDSAPAVGSVAWWDTSFSSTGHVAYVEKVISPDEILISEDNWGGDFRWRRVTRGGGRWPQGFIHLKDVGAPVATPADYQALAPTRLLDTRAGLGAARAVVPAGGKVSLQVAGRAGLPTRGVGAVVLNVTAVTPAGSGFLSLYPTGTDRPVVSSLNYEKGSTIANQVVAKVGDTGAVDIYASQATHLVVDVSGYYTSAGYLQTVAPTRLADSRYGLGTTRSRIPAGTRRDIAVVGAGGVPAKGASSVVLNVTAVKPSTTGWLTVWPATSTGTPPPSSSLNFTPGQTVAGLVVSDVGLNGKVSVFASQETDLVVDVAGYYPSAADFVGLTPTRVLDTRQSSKVAGGSSILLPVTGRAGVPAAGVESVMLTVVSTRQSSGGFLSAYPSRTTRPNASILNFGEGQTIANSVLVKVGSDGAVRLWTSATADLVVDVQGYVLK